MNGKVNDFLRDNAKGIIALIFFTGGIVTTITMQGVRLDKLEEKQVTYVTYAVQELQDKTLNARLDAIESQSITLKHRVRNAIDNDIKPVIKDVESIKCRLAVNETKLSQHKEVINKIN